MTRDWASAWAEEARTRPGGVAAALREVAKRAFETGWHEGATAQAEIIRKAVQDAPLAICEPDLQLWIPPEFDS